MAVWINTATTVFGGKLLFTPPLKTDNSSLEKLSNIIQGFLILMNQRRDNSKLGLTLFI